MPAADVDVRIDPGAGVREALLVEVLEEGRADDDQAEPVNPLKRGDIVRILPGVPGKKPRRGVIIQSDSLSDAENVLACPIVKGSPGAPIYRMTITPKEPASPGLAQEIVVDKVMTVPRARCESVVGRLAPSDMAAVNRLLALVFGLAD